MAGNEKRDSGWNTFGIIGGGVLLGVGGGAALGFFFPPALAAVMGFSFLGVKFFAFAAAFSFPVKVGMFSALTGLISGIFTAGMKSVVNLISSLCGGPRPGNEFENSIDSNDSDSQDNEDFSNSSQFSGLGPEVDTQSNEETLLNNENPEPVLPLSDLLKENAEEQELITTTNGMS